MSYKYSIYSGKHAKNNDKQINNEGETEPSLGKLGKHTQKAKETLNAAGNVLQNQEALEEVKEELHKGKGRVFFFFIIFVVNICLGKIKELYGNYCIQNIRLYYKIFNTLL